MIKSRSTILILAVLLTTSCSSIKKANDTETAAPTIVNEASDASGNSRFIASFFSPGNGIDHKMKKEYLAFLTNNFPKVSYEGTKWGKEGEIDFCFTLSELSMEEQLDFVKQSKDLLSKSSRVHIYENVPCRNKKGQ